MRYIDANGFFKTFSELDIEPYNTYPTEDVIPVCGDSYPYREPIKNRYVHEIDNSCDMLKCPECGCRIIADWFSYAVGNKGYAFCPYCGADLREDPGQMDIYDLIGGKS